MATTIVNKIHIHNNKIINKIIPLVNNAQMVKVDNHSVLSSYTMNTDSFYLHRKVTEVLPSVNMGIQTIKVIKLNPSNDHASTTCLCVSKVTVILLP